MGFEGPILGKSPEEKNILFLILRQQKQEGVQGGGGRRVSLITGSQHFIAIFGNPASATGEFCIAKCLQGVSSVNFYCDSQ